MLLLAVASENSSTGVTILEMELTSLVLDAVANRALETRVQSYKDIFRVKFWSILIGCSKISTNISAL